MKVKYTKKLTIIYDSYLIKDVAKEVRNIINKRVDSDYITTRTLKSYIRETKAHNRMYKLHLFRKHTKNTDLEEDIKLWKEVVYFILGI